MSSLFQARLFPASGGERATVGGLNSLVAGSRTPQVLVRGVAEERSALERGPTRRADPALAPTHDRLHDYRSKRDFARTPEPAAGGQPAANRLSFVVQKHWASRLHYDFRLELDGTMKSWAVPKGPSVDPSVKRMAVQVEDHPIAYADFEGTVPAKQYGAGKVIVWDAGTWIPLHDPRQGVREGNLKFELQDHKLNGRWVLVRMHGKDEKQAAWLLIKEKDAYARASAEYSVVDELPGSVKSMGPAPRDGAAGDGHRPACDPGLPLEAVPCALPQSLSPQLASRVAVLPADAAEWLYEIKFDGYRMLVRHDTSGVRLLTRNGHDWTSRLRPLQGALERMKLPPGWFDGEIVVANEAGVPDFGALLLGVHDAQGALRYAGDVGTGFTEKALKDLEKALDARARRTSPFSAESKIDGRPNWVTPTLVAEVSFGEWTRAGRIRHAVFRGLRSDKDADTIVRERALRMGPARASSTGRAVEPQALSDRLRVTNPQRVIDASTGTTKLELVRYYGLVGELMMKHLKGRPVSLLRAPEGVDGPLFFQKHLETEKLPDIRQLDPALSSGHPPMIEVTGATGLLSAAQWNVVEFHTLNAGTQAFEHPDRMVFDLDPGEGVPWPRVQEAAQLVHAFLAQLGLPSYLKTSGGKGLHVVVPVKRLHDWDTVKEFSRAVVAHMSTTIPRRFVARSGPKHRVGKIFIDYLRNGLGASTVCAWSARARPGLGISVPVSWEELPSLRGGDHWSVKTVHERLDTGNEPWAGYARAARGLAPAMAALGRAPRAA